MKHILCIIDSLSSGGAQRQFVGLAVFLKRKGYDVKVITYHDIPFYLPYLVDHNIDYECISCGRDLVTRLIGITRIVKSFKPDVVISYLDTPNILACILKIFNPRLKLLVSERNTTQTLSIRDRLRFFLYRFADYIVPNSHSQLAYIKVNFPKLADRCRVITNYVETGLFVPMRKKYNSDDIRIIGVGRIANQKNIPVLIEALKKVRDHGENVRVDWYGKPFESYDECRKLINEYGLSDYFAFHLPYNTIVEKYNESDVFVLPSLYEGFPNVLCEAMSCGLISIASNVCDNSDIIKDGANGFLFPSGDSQKLSECILRVIRLSEEQRKKMSISSRQCAIDLFSEEVFINKYID